MSSERPRRRADEADRAEAELLRRLEQGVGDLGPVGLRRILASPFSGERVVRAILSDREAVEHRGVRRALAAHPRTPPAEAMRLLSTLFWTDLLEIGRDTRVPPRIRRAAHKILVDRYDGLAVGERVAIARRAGNELLITVRHDREPRVVAAMLNNPRLTEGILMPVLTSGRTTPDVLALIGRRKKWVSRYEVRRQLCRNRRTPTTVALPLLPRLTKGDLSALALDPRVSPEVRRRAELLTREPGARRPVR